MLWSVKESRQEVEVPYQQVLVQVDLQFTYHRQVQKSFICSPGTNVALILSAAERYSNVQIVITMQETESKYYLPILIQLSTTILRHVN